MPEGPEVKIITEFLRIQAKGWYLSWDSPIEHDHKSKYLNKSESFLKLRGWLLYITRVFCKGKQIFFELEAQSMFYEPCKQLKDLYLKKERCKFYLNSTLGTEGKWVLINQHRDCQSKDKSLADPKHSNLWLNLVRENEEKELFFNDVRHQGNFFVFDEREFQEKWDKIGPDLLSEKVSYQEYYNVISRSRLKQKQICDFLLAQQYFSGIGNYLKAEILYECEIRPDRTLGELTKKEKQILWQVSKALIRDSYESGGKTIRSFYRPDGKTGNFQVLVYGRKTDPNGRKVFQNTFKDKRNTYWVPSVQK